MPSVTGKVANTIGVAPRRPAQPSSSRSRQREAASATTSAASGRATAAVMRAIAVALADDRRSSCVREHEQPEHQEEPELRDPGEAVVEGDDRAPGRRRRGAEHEAGQVDGEEARAVRATARRRTRARRSRPRRPGTGRPTAAVTLPQEEHGEGSRPRGRPRRRSTARWTASQSASPTPEVGVLDRLDAADHEQHRDRVVDAGLALERARQAPPQRRAAQHREHRGRVGRGHGRAEEQRLAARSRSNSALAASAVSPAVPMRARASRAGSTSRAPAGSRRSPLDRPPSKRMKASAMTADLLGDLEVVEVDPARARRTRSACRCRARARGRASASAQRPAKRPAQPPAGHRRSGRPVPRARPGNPARRSRFRCPE